MDFFLTDAFISGITFQNVYFGRYIFGNSVLQRHVRGDVKWDFQMYIQRYTSLNKNFEYDYPHSNALSNIFLKKDSGNVT